jgi:hypothetical protein
MEKVLTQLIQNPEGRKSESSNSAAISHVRFCLHRPMTMHPIAHPLFLHRTTLHDTDSNLLSFCSRGDRRRHRFATTESQQVPHRVGREESSGQEYGRGE